MDGGGGVGLGQDTGSRWREKLTCGPQTSAGERRGGAYPFGVLPGWASGRKEVWAGLVPLGPFSYFNSFSFFFFFFSNFYLFHTFANLLQIKFKTLSKFL
jgi:hypothetical protein